VWPAEVQQQFPVVLNSGITVHKPLFEDLMREVAAGRRSFEEWVRSHLQHQHHLYYQAVRTRWAHFKGNMHRDRQRCVRHMSAHTHTCDVGSMAVTDTVWPNQHTNLLAHAAPA
jgi:hypothetical protein